MLKKYNKIAIVSAMKKESEYLEEELQNRGGWKKISENSFKNVKQRISIINKIVGIGKVNSASGVTELICKEKPNFIINVGVSGGLLDDASRGRIAIGQDYVQTDFAPFFQENKTVIQQTPQYIVDILKRKSEERNYFSESGLLATGDFFLSNEKTRERIIRKYHPISFDMETAAIAQVATNYNVVFAAIRIFSDLANKDSEKYAIENRNGNIDEEEKKLQNNLAMIPIILAIDLAEELKVS